MKKYILSLLMLSILVLSVITIQADNEVFDDTNFNQNSIYNLTNVNATTGTFTGNLTAGFFIGDGGFITGLIFTESDPLFTGNLTGGFEGNINPDTDSTRTIGTTLLRWLTGWFDNIVVGIGNFTSINSNDWTNVSITSSQITDDAFLLNTGDTATGNYTFDTDTFFIDSSSNRIGIGTTTPSVSLEVIGSGIIGLVDFISDTVFASSIRVTSVDDSISTGNSGINFGGNNKFINFETDATERMRIILDGKVGINTTNPEELLNVVGTDVSIMVEGDGVTRAGFKIKTNNVLRWDINSPSAQARLVFLNGTGTNVMTLLQEGGAIFNDDSQAVDFRIEGDGNSAMFFVNGTSDRVGIGTTDPERRFHVLGDSRFSKTGGTDGDLIFELIAGTSGVSRLRFGDSDIDVGEIYYNHTLNSLSFRTNAVNDRMVIDSSGNIGIGITNPIVNLDIVGSDSAPGTNAGIFQIRNQSSSPYIQLHMGVNSTDGYVWIEATEFGTSNNRDIILNSLGGNVGIGTISPSERLDLGSGNFITTGAILGGGAGHDQFSDFVANEHIDWTSTSSNFLTTGTLDSGKITVTGASAQIDLDGSGGITEILSGATLEIRQSRDASAPIIDFRGLALDTSSSTQFRFGLSSLSSAANEIVLIAPNSTTIASSIGTGFIDFNRNQADTDFRISSQNNVNMFYLDASTDRIGINNPNPSATLDVVGNQELTGNLTLGEKITFSLGEIIDNIVDGFIRVTGNLNVTDNVTADFYFGDGSQLTGISGGSGIWTNVSGVATYEGDVNITGNLTVGDADGDQILVQDGSASAPSYSFAGQTNVGWYRIGIDDVGLSLGGIRRMRVTSSTLELENLDIITGLNTGDPRLEANPSISSPAFTFHVDTDTGIFRDTANTIGFSTGGTERFRVASDGFIGINTSTPQNLLNVLGDTNITGTLYFGTLDGEANLNVNSSTWQNTQSIGSLNDFNSTEFKNTAGEMSIILSWLIGIITDNSIADIVEDLTPQLGGYLDTNTQNIGATDDEIENIYVGVNTRIYFGDGQEASIFYNGTALIISG